MLIWEETTMKQKTSRSKKRCVFFHLHFASFYFNVIFIAGSRSRRESSRNRSEYVWHWCFWDVAPIERCCSDVRRQPIRLGWRHRQPACYCFARNRSHDDCRNNGRKGRWAGEFLARKSFFKRTLGGSCCRGRWRPVRRRSRRHRRGAWRPRAGRRSKLKPNLF